MTKALIMLTRVKAYFEDVYSADKNIAGIRLFGINEDERAQVIRNNIGDCNNKTVLDIGCGNGVVLNSALTGTPSLIRLEDLVENNVQQAKNILLSRARKIEAVAVNGFDGHHQLKYDKVLMIGVTDYYSNWCEVLDLVIQRTGEMLILDFPKSTTARMFLRKIWLGLHGLKTRSASQKQLFEFLESNLSSYSYDVDETVYNWVVTVFIKNK